MYCSDNDELGDHIPGCRLLRTFENMFNKYHVDLVMTGH